MHYPLRRRIGVVAATLCLLASVGQADAEQITLKDVHGVSRRPLQMRGKRATVLFFILQDCPIANRYAPEINRIVAAYTPKRIAFYVVYVDPALKPKEARKHAKDYGYRCPALLDPAHRLAKKIGATISPEAVVIGPDGKRMYCGRIDDLYIDLGRQRYEATQHDLREALDAILSGRSVPNPVTKAVGCFIPPKK